MYDRAGCRSRPLQEECVCCIFDCACQHVLVAVWRFIPGKGSSEWSYARIPSIAPLVGGVIAGVLYIAIEEMQFPGGGTKGSGGNFVG